MQGQGRVVIVFLLVQCFSRVLGFAPAMKTRSKLEWIPSNTRSKDLGLRLSSSPRSVAVDRFVRWNEPISASSPNWLLQTSVCRYQRNNTIIDLHAMVHYASREYFEFYNSLNNTVVFEMLVDEQLLKTVVQGNATVQIVSTPMGASQADLQIARSYGLSCQATVVNFTRPTFVHGDWTRQEIMKMVEDKKPSPALTRWFSINRPLWQEASEYSAGKDATTALLIGTPQLLASRNLRSTRAFPFHRVVHSRAVSILRPFLWLTVPSPEVSILLLDWSASNELTLGSPVSCAVLQSLVFGDWNAVRKLVFGQVLVSTTMDSNVAGWIELRNQRAIQTLNQVIAAGGGFGASQTVSVLFGCLHCRDLHYRILDMGFKLVENQWRNAWSVQAPPLNATRLLDSNVLRILFLLVAYLGVGGLDWIGIWGDVTHDFAAFAASHEPMTIQSLSGIMVEYMAYIVRHLFLYMGLSQFLWTPKE